MSEKILYSPPELSELISKGEVILVDIRDKEKYEEGHIRGAVNLPQLFYYLAESTEDGLAAMHQELGFLFSKAGILFSKKVVVYEESLDTGYGGSCRGCWFLRYVGHPDAGILDGGLAAWVGEGFPLDSGTPAALAPSRFVVSPRHELIATRLDVENAISDPSIIVVDNRDRDEWRGESSSPYGVDFAPRKGRIPGGLWIEWYEFMERGGKTVAFKSPEAIRRICETQGIGLEDDVILCCFKGARSANTYIALRLAGFERVRVYLGAWNEWSRDPALPIDEGVLA